MYENLSGLGSSGKNDIIPLIRAPRRIIKPRLMTSRGIFFDCDCLLLLQNLKDNSIDCIFADPPFNLGKKYSECFRDRLPEKEYLEWSYKWMKECYRVLKPGGAIFIYIIPKWGYHFASFLDTQLGLSFRHWIAMSMKSTYRRGKRLYPAHYGLLYFTKGKPRVFRKIRTPIPLCRHCQREIKDYGGHRKHINKKGLNLTDFWDDTSPNRHKNSKFRKANELKPIIPERAINISTRKNDIVLDMFGGSGCTYEICENNSRFWIGSEIGSCMAIRSRMKKYSSKCDGLPEKILGLFKSSHP